MVGRLTEIAELPGLEHLVVDTDAVLVGQPAQALFSPCTVGHPNSADCRAWDDVGPGPTCRTYRYALTRQWDLRPPAVFIMLNPSVADAFKPDKTITRCLDFARRWDCGGLLVLNAFALRSTSPMALRRHEDPVGPNNDQVIEAALAGEREQLGPVVLGWGANFAMSRSGRGPRIVKLLDSRGITPLHLHANDDGSPQHPLFVAAETKPQPYARAVAAGRGGDG